jgi:hypothetical protein
MTFPQRWNAATNTIAVRVAALPFTDPLSLLAAGETAFADTDLAFQFRLIPSLLRLPQSADANAPLTRGPVARHHRRALFEHLNKRFNIAVPPATPPPAIGSRRVKKYLPVSYREAFAFRGPQHPFVTTDSSYHCSFESAQTVDPDAVLETRVSWGEVLGYVLRNRLIAEEAGLLFEFAINAGDAFTNGGWLYVELQPGTPFAALADVRRYAARLPALGAQNRPVFGALQFPVDDPAASDDARVFIEAETYSDGFAKVVHGAQPVASGPTDTDLEEGPGPIRDRGIRLGWDDEQIATWLNRQIGLDPYSGAAPKLAAPTAVLGYRVDVRHAKTTEGWTSLTEVQGAIVLEAINGLPELDLGLFQGELGVETMPMQLQGKKDGDFWLPTHFVSWAGGSLVLSDPAALEIDNHDEILAAQRYTAVGAGAVPLRYGRDYEFRVRLMDLSSGGPNAGDKAEVSGDAPVALVPFRRYVPPKAPTVVRGDGGAAADPPVQLAVRRPRLGYPDIVFAQGNSVIADLIAERDRLLALPEEERLEEVALPDPDAVAVRITVAVRQLAMDETEFRELYTVERAFPAVAATPLDVQIEYVDRHDVASIDAPAAGDPLPLPTARQVRLSFQTVGKSTPDYFGSEQARFSSASTVMTVQAPSADETGLFAGQTPAERLSGFFLLPDTPITGLSLALLAFNGIRQPPALESPRRLAQELDLECSGLSMWAKPGRRTLFGAALALQHQLAVDHASINFGSETDLTRQWIVVLHLKLDRDWTWDALEKRGALRIFRDDNFVGAMDLPRVVNRHALVEARRGQTELIFFDAIDGKPAPGDFPDEMQVRYRVEPVFRTPPIDPPEPPAPELRLRLPVTPPPHQTPKLVSAGLALTPFSHDHRYASTAQRRRKLWLEFDRPPDDAQDRYYCRVLANSPDPMLISVVQPLPEPPEPALPIPAEPIRRIVPDQPADAAGLDAMMELQRSPDAKEAVHFLVPLPDNLDESSLELFGFFTYELRVGHNQERWCTAHGRWGPPLRVTGVQHPAPPLVCQVVRTQDRIEVRAPFATPVLNGMQMRPPLPLTDMWILLYAQVLQADGAAWRNVLLSRQRAEQIRDDANPDFPRPQTVLEFATTAFPQSSVDAVLGTLGLAADAPLSVLAVELMPEIILRAPHEAPRRDPLGESLGDVRILRTSPLVPVPPVC